MSLASFFLRCVAVGFAWGFLADHGLVTASILLVIVVPLMEALPLDLLKGGW